MGFFVVLTIKNTRRKFGRKTANINIKNCSLSMMLTALDQKPQKIIIKVILLSSTLTFSLIQVM